MYCSLYLNTSKIQFVKIFDKGKHNLICLVRLTSANICCFLFCFYIFSLKMTETISQFGFIDLEACISLLVV